MGVWFNSREETDRIRWRLTRRSVRPTGVVERQAANDLRNLLEAAKAELGEREPTNPPRCSRLILDSLWRIRVSRLQTSKRKQVGQNDTLDPCAHSSTTSNTSNRPKSSLDQQCKRGEARTLGWRDLAQRAENAF
jgi:hypothetical protein